MPGFDWNIHLPLHFGRDNANPLTLTRALPTDSSRPAVEAYVSQRFQQVHGAQIQHFMPELFAFSDIQGRLCAVAGVRLAESGPVFLERYLDRSIDSAIVHAVQTPVERQAVVEVGNLAASDNGSARLSIIAITWLLAMGDLEWVAFTGNAGLVNSFHRLGLQPLCLGPADPQRLGDESRHWGRYYQGRPAVYVGSIRAGFVHLRNMGMFKRLGLPLSFEESAHVA